jgi:redox-sensing transcriptional repressor
MASALPSATIERLPRYLRCLNDMSLSADRCSSDQLAAAAGVNAAQVRKDLSYVGTQGTRGVGYEIADLIHNIRIVLGITKSYPVVIVGAGNLGSALSNYKGFKAWGFEIAAVVDNDDSIVGTQIGDLTVESTLRLASIVKKRGIQIGIIATPASAAQGVADQLILLGVKSILNLAPTVLKSDDSVGIRRVDLPTELGILAYHLSR